MGAVHVRTPKNFVLEERLERYADAIETNPEAYAGDWREACAPVGSKPFEHLHLDLGCGKGTYLVERAAHEPNTLFIGMDQEPICIAYAAQKICEQELSNALVLPRGAASLPQLFAAGELDAITINFPTPQPKAKYAKKRLVHVDHLMLYRPLFAAGATVTLRTDSKPLRDYALGQFAAAGYDTLWVSDDVRRDHPEHPRPNMNAARARWVPSSMAFAPHPAHGPAMNSSRRAVRRSKVLPATCPKTSMSSPMYPWAWKRPSRTLETAPARARSACRKSPRGF